MIFIASSEAKNAAMLAISSGVLERLSGIDASIRAAASASVIPFTLSELLHHALIQTRPRRPRADGVDVNIMFGQLGRANTGHGDHCPFGAGI